MSKDSRSESVDVLLLCLRLNPFEDIVELAEDSPHEVFLGQRKCFNCGIGNIKEFTLEILSEVEVTKVLVSPDELSKFVLLGVLG